MALEVDGGLVLSALLVILIVSLLTYILSHHPKHLTNNMATEEAVGGEAQDTHVVNQDNLLEKSKIITEEKETTNQYVELLKEMEEQMSAINHLIDDAEVKDTSTNLGLKQWLHNLKEVVYDAEDVRDVIATQVSTSIPWNPFDRSLHQELGNVLRRMKRLSEQNNVFGLRPSTCSETSRPPTSSLVDGSGVYGRADDEEKIKKLLLSNDGNESNVSVIAIVGMGGLGKTTLAKLVFNHYQIDSVFKSNKVWICVEKDFDVVKITKTILEKLTEQSYATNDFDGLQRKLRDTLYGKKFLMVLDDVWNEDRMIWDSLREPFGFAAQGSKIIVTTRSERVASVMRATSTYKLDPLSEEACWKLFSKHAFDENTQSNVYSKFEANVVKKCGGLPLAAKVLGGLLRGLGCAEWEEILRSNIWDLSDEVLPVLRLSYYYLPSYLKRCFAFCSIVPKDYDFEREQLVLLWMAENLLQDSKDSKKRIDVGYEYLRELESRSLIQPASHGEYIDGELHFSMHDLVNDLAKSVSGEFYKSFDLGNSFNVGEKTRHFSYVVTSDNYENPIRFKGVNEVNCLRTFLPLIRRWNLGIKLPPLLYSKIWPRLNVLRSLTLAKACIQNLPDSIGNLKLLRYLDLSKNEFKQLPESLASLYNLEVLNLSCCYNLKKLPGKMTQLIKLNYLNIRDTSLKKMPLEMGRLKDLDVLTDFVLGKGSGSSIGELKGLKDLRGVLRIHGLENITDPEEALVANLKGKSKLEELRLYWRYFDSDNNSEDATIILKNLRPHVKLKKLYIQRYPGTRLPDWLGQYSFANLASIEIYFFPRCVDLSPLGQLPYLKTLRMSVCHSVVTLVPTEVPAGHFSALVYCDIEACPRLELPQHHCFTSIEKLSLRRGSCASLQFFPMSSFPKLKELRLEGLRSIKSLTVIDEANNLNLEYLESIQIYECDNFEYFNDGKWCAPRMKDLELNHCESLKVLPDNMCNLFPSLLKLKLIKCSNLEALPQSGWPGNLSTLRIMGCKKLIANRSSWGLQRLLSLSHLSIGDFECDDSESFPEEGLLPSSLSTLRIYYVPNLRSLNGKSFQLLTSLETLELEKCPKLQCLPEEGLLASLSTLQIWKCPLLESRCQREQGEDWSKIAHIPNIDIRVYP